MSSVNKVFIVGNLGADPELRSTGSGHMLCRMSVATNRKWRNAKGEEQEEVCWHRITAWGKSAETCHQYLRKGRRILVEGRIENKSYTDKDGQKRQGTNIISDRVIFLDTKERHQGEQMLPTLGADNVPF